MTAPRLKLLLGGAVGLAAALYAGYWTVEEWRYRALVADRALVAGDRDRTVKPGRECPDPSETLVFVTFGQSNGANHGSVRLSAPVDAYDFYDGTCFSGDDPQFLATGFGGSPWPAFAGAVRGTGETRPLLIASIGVGNTRADEWITGTAHGQKLERVAGALTDKGYRVAAFLFFQGESDRETPGAEYRAALDDIAQAVRRAAPDAHLVMSDSSICGPGRGPVAALTAARLAVAADSQVHLGPDTDRLGANYRSDGCHFNESGLRALGRLWALRLAEILG